MILLASSGAAQYPTGYDPADYGDYDDYARFQNGCGSEVGDRGSKQVSYETYCTSGNDDGGTVEAFEVEFRVGDETTFAAEGARVAGASSGSGSVIAFEYLLEVREIVEFRDDGDGKYIPEKDETIHKDSITASGWGAIRSSTPESGGIAFEADYTMARGGTFSIHGKATGGTYSEGGVSVKPFDTKIDFLFSGYQYSADDTQLAIVLDVESEGAVVQGSGRSSFGQGGGAVQSSERGLVGAAGSTQVYFTWAKTATVDGKSTPVGHHVVMAQDESANVESEGGSVSAYEAKAAVSLAYERGDEIVHDPRLGVQFNVKKDSPGVATVSLVAVLALAALVRRR